MDNELQLSLFAVAKVYETAEDCLSNDNLYRNLSNQCGIPLAEFSRKGAVGKAAQQVSLLKRKVRWYQQTLKTLGILERTNQRGVWRYVGKQKQLTENTGRLSLWAFSTRLGVAIWGCTRKALQNLDEPINLVITSPPYPLRSPREYGNPSEQDYTDFICSSLEPLVKNLHRSASLCINLGNDIFLQGSPARSLYKEHLIISLHQRLGLHKMDELVWVNPCKPPGPVQWASLTRQQLNVGYEVILWMSPSPEHCKANNQRVLEEHTAQHREMQARGQRTRATHSDGAYRRRFSSYQENAGRIPRNVITLPHNCVSQSNYKKIARMVGLPVHGAPFPLKLALFLIRFLSEPDDLVVDPFSGSTTTGIAAEILNRRWMCIDKILEYVAGSVIRFKGCPGLVLNPQLPLFHMKG